MHISYYICTRAPGKRVIEDYSKTIFLNENICCDPSLEPSQWDGSNDGSQNMFFMEKYS